jgi:hypothetical protein
MKLLYRIILISVVLFHSSLLFGQGPVSRQEQSSGKSPKSFYQNVSDTKGSKSIKNQTNAGSGITLKPGASLPIGYQQDNSAGPTERTCFTVESEGKLKERFPHRLSTEFFENQLAQRMSSYRIASGPQIVYKIPTVVHVVHHGEPVGIGSNITQEQIMSQFDVLNEDFRRIGGGHNEHPDGADIQIEFVPVLVDPQGNLLEEPGIDRVFGYNAHYEYDPIEYELKPNTQWDPDRYFNIWVLKFGGGFSNILGYAQFPTLSGLDGLSDEGFEFTDGIVIGYQYFGRTGNVKAPFNLGRTTTHEVGHWLGLRHIWGDGDCTVDDYCADTPNASGPNYSCTIRDSCPGDGPDMIENYMDYSTDGCMNIFTNDQRSRIRTVMELSPRRNTLVACQVAPLADVGTNTADKVRAWYEYTAPENQLVTISSIGIATIDTRVSVYRECNALPMNVSDNAFGTEQSELTISLSAGETIKIQWEGVGFDLYSFEPFNWELSTNPQESGAACELAVTAIEGSNYVPATTLKTFWFEYAPADQTKVTISSEGQMFALYGSDCNQLTPLKTSNGTATMYHIPAGEKTLVEFVTEGGNFNWTLSTAPLRSGEVCNDAAEALPGQNIIPHTSPFEYWYTFTMPYDGELNLRGAEFPQGNVNVKLFKSCGGILLAEASGSQFELTGIRLSSGQTILIHFDGAESTSDFEWYLETAPFANGEICAVAKAAQIGMNHTDGTPQWFTYTTTKFTNLKISSVGFTDVNTHVMIKQTCNGPITDVNDNYNTSGSASEQSELVLFGLNAGEKVYILWSEKWSYEGFDWSLEEVDPLPGDNCQNAKQAVVGMNTVEYRPNHAHFGEIFWTKFTVPFSGKKITAFGSKAVDMAIYSHENCGKYTLINTDQGKASAFNLPAGTEILILWDVNGYKEDFTWQLTVENIVNGDLCTKPTRAVKGVNSSRETPVWYDYVMAADGSLKLEYTGSRDNGIIPYVSIFSGCNGTDEEILYQGIGSAFVSGLNQGDHVVIYWTLGYPFPKTTFTLQEIPRKQGDVCSNPLPAVYGLNHTEYATQWFSYTVENPGTVKISSRAFTDTFTDLYVYDACGGNLLASSNIIISWEDFIEYYQSEVFLENMEIGQTLLIQWSGRYSFAPFYWEITDGGPQKGDSCEDPLIAVEGVNNAMKPTPAWFTFTMPRTGTLTLSSLGYTDNNTFVEIYDDCDGTLLAVNDDFGDAQSFVSLEGLTEGQTVKIYWNNAPNSWKYTFNWRLHVGELEPGIVCHHPAAAQVGINTVPAHTSTFYWYSFTMPEDNKKLVITRLSTSERQTAIGVTTDCDFFNVYGISNNNRLELKGLSSGEQLLIFLGEGRLGERPSFDLEIAIVDFETGDSCDDPIEVLPGKHQANGTVTWYQYTLPKNGNVRITSKGLNDRWTDTYLEVYDGCNGNLLASNDNPEDWSSMLSEVLIEDLPADQTLWIRWNSAPPFMVDFTWKLSVEGAENSAPSLDHTYLELEPSPVNGKVVGTLLAQDADGDELYYQMSGGNSDGAFALDMTTGTLTIADASKIPDAGVTRELTVTVTDRIALTEATVTIDIVTGTLDDIKSLIQVYPNPAKDRINIGLPENLTISKVTLISISGQVVKEAYSNNHEIFVMDVPRGMYILSIVTNKGPISYKVSISK